MGSGVGAAPAFGSLSAGGAPDDELDGGVSLEESGGCEEDEDVGVEPVMGPNTMSVQPSPKLISCVCDTFGPVSVTDMVLILVMDTAHVSALPAVV